MKRNILFLITTCLVIFGLIFSGCNGGGVLPDTNPESESDYFFGEDIDLIQIKDPNSNILFAAVGENQREVIILGDKNSQGEPINKTGTICISEQGDMLYFKTGEKGKVLFIIDGDGNKITFQNYTDSTVDLTLYDYNGNIVDSTTADIDLSCFYSIQDYLGTKTPYNFFPSQSKMILGINFPAIDPLTWHILGDFAAGLIHIDIDLPILNQLIGMEATASGVIVMNINSNNYITSPPEVEVPSYECFLPECTTSDSFTDNVHGIHKDIILSVLDSFINAMNNEKWEEAKTYCVPNSEATETVDEFKSAFNELYDMCDQFTYQCSGSPSDPVITIPGWIATTATATFSVSSISCTVTCVIGSEDITLDVSASGSEKYYFKKIGKDWLIEDFEGAYAIDYEEI